MAELLRDDSATLKFSVGVLLVIGGKDTPEIQLKTAFIEIDGQPMMMMMRIAIAQHNIYMYFYGELDQLCAPVKGA